MDTCPDDSREAPVWSHAMTGALSVENNRRLLRARDAMDRSYADALDIEALADSVHLSRAHFIRSFKDTFGETPHRYLQRRRVERAMFLLRTTDRPVTDICFETGFGSLGTFSRTFTAIVGESPTAYRRRGVVHSVPSCFAMAWTRPSSFTHAESSSSGEARTRRASVPSAP
jgi:AraC-like DNA-binding protein